jgi:hypothetical protein
MMVRNILVLATVLVFGPALPSLAQVTSESAIGAGAQGAAEGATHPDRDANPAQAATTGAGQGAVSGAIKGAVGGAVGGPHGAAAGAGVGAAQGAAQGGAAGAAKGTTSRIGGETRD